MRDGAPAGFRSGFVCIAGRPNVGKSTLLNRLVRGKVAIVSRRPQTTRHAIRGILTLDAAQVVLVDTPGFHKPRNLLGERMNDVVRRTMKEVDAILLVLDASEPIGRGDRYVAEEVARAATPVICVLSKADLVSPPQLLAQIEVARLLAGQEGPSGPWRDVLTTSAARGTGLDFLLDAIVSLLPEGPMYYAPGSVTDQPEHLVVAEIVREKVLELTREEVPHSVAVIVDEMQLREGSDLVDVRASVVVERDSQKGIVIGRGGRMLKEIGTRARREIEGLLGSHIFLDLRVKLEPRWQRSEEMLRRFGYG